MNSRWNFATSSSSLENDSSKDNDDHQDQDQDSLLVKRRNDNPSPGPVVRELSLSFHQRSELSTRGPNNCMAMIEAEGEIGYP